MIQTYTWRVDPPLGSSVTRSADKFLIMANGIMAYTSFLRGATAVPGENEIMVSLRVYGNNRWSAQAHAREIGEKIFKSSGMWGWNAELVSVEIEANRRGLKNGEGRTPRPRKKRITWD